MYNHSEIDLEFHILKSLRLYIETKVLRLFGWLAMPWIISVTWRYRSTCHFEKSLQDIDGWLCVIGKFSIGRSMILVKRFCITWWNRKGLLTYPGWKMRYFDVAQLPQRIGVNLAKLQSRQFRLRFDKAFSISKVETTLLF